MITAVVRFSELVGIDPQFAAHEIAKRLAERGIRFDDIGSPFGTREPKIKPPYTLNQDARTGDIIVCQE
jgi:hypothetical protein